MKRIIKDPIEPDTLSNWKATFLAEHGKPAHYPDFCGAAKQSYKVLLLNEQGHLCCYCMKRVTDTASHIEHFKPQHPYQDEDMCYHNMFISCNGLQRQKDSCGHKKDDWYDSALSVSPLESNVEQLFTYSLDGKIHGVDYKAQAMINHLGLNHYHLVRSRKTAIQSSGIFDEDFEEKRASLADNYTHRDAQNTFIPFCNAVLYCIATT